MAQTPQEFIQFSFSPMIAVTCSPTVDQIVSKNNLNFVELLQPFCGLNSEGHVRDPSGAQCTVKNLRLIVRDIHSRPPQPISARKLLNESVNFTENEKSVSLLVGNHKLEVTNTTPWFESWRQTYFEVQFPSEHEFTKHYVACLVVGTTADNGPVDTYNQMVQQLAQLQNVAPPKLPKWFNNNVLRCYVLIHDVASGSKDRAERSFESLKQAYGAGNCFFLCINSRTNTQDGDSESLLPDPWKQYVTRNTETNDGSGRGSLPRTPVDARAVSSLPSSLSTGSLEGTVTPPNIVTPPASSPHPLSPSEEADVTFDSANSLQNTFSGSTESVPGYINPQAWDATVAPLGGARHGGALTSQDVDNLRSFISDFAYKALLPYFERQISQLHDAVSNRKGVSRSLLSATKRWFGTNKPGINTTINTVIYNADCPELQLRRLGDLWFMLGQWSAAFQAYHTAKREFNADSAWLCYAGALEMAALSAFMAGEPSRKTYDYMEESIKIYNDTCRMAQYAVRATLLSTQCLSSRGLHGEAATQLIRMTSEDSDLRSAVLLEQAALCFLAPPRRPLPRKYAFHMVLAGHRYSKAGQRRHALRCYNQAYQVYASSGWRLAVDHVQFALGRLAGQLRRWDEAVRALAAPLAPSSPQPPAQQAALLREYMRHQQQWTESSENSNIVPTLPLPLVNSNATIVLCGGIAPLSSPGRISATGTALPHADAAEPVEPAEPAEPACWSKLEEMLLHMARGSTPMIFKPTVSLFTDYTDNSVQPNVPQGEPVQVLVEVENPLKIPLTLMDVQLLWSFRSTEDNTVPAVSPVSAVVAQQLSVLVLEGECCRRVALCLTPLQAGELIVQGITFKLSTSAASEGSDASPVIVGKQMFEIRGAKRQAARTAHAHYAQDMRLHINVTPRAPCLQVSFTTLPDVVYCGELQRIEMEYRNAGPVGMAALHMAVSDPRCVALHRGGAAPFLPLLEERYEPPPADQDERAWRARNEARWRRRHACSVSPGQLSAGECARGTLLLRVPQRPGTHRLHALFYYQPHADTTLAVGTPKYRLLRHTWTLNVQESVHLSVIPRRCMRLNPDSGTSLETLNMAIELLNADKGANGNTAQVQALNASLLSQTWLLNNLVPLGDDNTTLNNGEKCHIVLRSARARDIEPCEIRHTDLNISKESPESTESISVSPYADFVCDFSSPFAENPETSTTLKEFTRRHCENINSTVVLRWKLNVQNERGELRSAIGQHYLWMDTFDKRVSTESETRETTAQSEVPVRLFGLDEVNSISNKNSSGGDDSMVIYRLEHSKQVSHNFGRSRLCTVPVKIHVVNCVGHPVVASVDLTTRGAGGAGVGWVGLGAVQLCLQAHQAGVVEARAVCAKPGAFLLGDTLTLTCRRHAHHAKHAHTATHAQHDTHTQRHRATSLLLVSSA